MTELGRTNDSYLFGRSERETERLVAQAHLYDLPLRRLFEDAGVGPGLRVLDVRSGPGDVAFTAARLVGPVGSVVGIEVNPALVETARRRSHEAGLSNVSFVLGDVSKHLELDDNVDAIVGRFVLTHLPDPSAALRRLLSHLRPGGIVAFQEILQQGSYASYPPLPTLEKLRGWALESITRSGRNTSGGLALHQIFLAAGLPAPEMRVHAAVINGPDSPHIGLLVDGFRNALPRAIELGVATAKEVDIDTLEQRVRTELAATPAAALGRLTVDAWTRKPWAYP